MPTIARWAFVFDLETTDTAPTAEVLTIGVAVVDTLTRRITAAREWWLDLNSQTHRTRSPETLAWWRGIGGVAYARAFRPDMREEVSSVMRGINNLIMNATASSSGDISVWGNGALFDIALLESLFTDVGIMPAWTFRQVRDLRTIYEAAGVERIAAEAVDLVPHVAIDDASEEAARLIRALGILDLRPDGEAAEKPPETRAETSCGAEPMA